TVGVPPAPRRGGEALADAPLAGGTEQRVDHGVGQHVGVGVPVQAPLVRNLDAPEDQPASGGETVGVKADAGQNAHRARPCTPARATSSTCADPSPPSARATS